MKMQSRKKTRLRINNSVDHGLPDHLYTALSLVVNIRILMRRICPLMRDLPNISNHIQVTNILDRFLSMTGSMYLRII